jgi:hypothetical protein
VAIFMAFQSTKFKVMALFRISTTLRIGSTVISE